MKNMEDFMKITVSKKVEEKTGGDCIEAWVLQTLINFEQKFCQPCLCYQELAHSVGCGDNDFAVGIIALMERNLIKHLKVVVDGKEYNCYKSNL